MARSSGRDPRGGRSSHQTRIETISEGGGKIQFLCDGQARSFVLSERTDAQNGLTTHPRLHRPQESSSIHNLIPANDLQICMGRVWTAIFEVSDDANFAGCTSTRISTVGGVAKCCGQFVKAWSETLGVLACSSGESEFGSGGENSDRSCGTAVNFERGATWRLSLTQLQQLGWFTGSDQGKSDEKFESPKCQDWRIRATRKPSILGRNHCCATQKLASGSLSMLK